MIDSVRTFLAKHQDHLASDLLAMAVEYGVLPEHATEDDLTTHRPNPEGEGHFAAYDGIAEQLLEGATLSTREVQQLLGPIHMALHQDRRFYETKDGHWYLAHQQICNEPFVEMLSTMPGEAVRLKDLLLGLEGAPTFWKADERFTFDGELITLNPVSLPLAADIEEDEYEDLGFAELFASEPEMADHSELPMAVDHFLIACEPEEAQIQQMTAQTTEISMVPAQDDSKMQLLLEKLARLQSLRANIGHS